MNTDDSTRFRRQVETKVTPVPSHTHIDDVCLHYTIEKNKIWPEHCHTKHQIIIVPEPKTDCEISWVFSDSNRKNVILNNQSIIYIEKEVAHAFRTGECGAYISLGVSDVEAQRLTQGNMWKGVRIVPWWRIIRHDTFIWSIIQVLRAHCYIDKLPHPNDIVGHARALLSHLLAIDKMRKATTADGLTPLQLRNVEIFIEEHIAERITVDELAGVAGLKRDHFSHLFKKSTGFSPHKFLIAQRLELARRLKILGSMTNAEIAAESGFFDESHLNHAIKQFCMDGLENYHGILPPIADSSNEEAQ